MSLSISSAPEFKEPISPCILPYLESLKTIIKDHPTQMLINGNKGLKTVPV